jgi:hypothetical protein
MAGFSRSDLEKLLADFAELVDDRRYRELTNEADFVARLGCELLPGVKDLHFEIPLSSQENWFQGMAVKITQARAWLKEEYDKSKWRMDLAVFDSRAEVRSLTCVIEVKHFSVLEEVEKAEVEVDIERLHKLRELRIARHCYMVVAYDKTSPTRCATMARIEKNRLIQKVVVPSAGSFVAVFRVRS